MGASGNVSSFTLTFSTDLRRCLVLRIRSAAFNFTASLNPSTLKPLPGFDVVNYAIYVSAKESGVSRKQCVTTLASIREAIPGLR